MGKKVEKKKRREETMVITASLATQGRPGCLNRGRARRYLVPGIRYVCNVLNLMMPILVLFLVFFLLIDV